MHIDSSARCQDSTIRTLYHYDNNNNNEWYDNNHNENDEISLTYDE